MFVLEGRGMGRTFGLVSYDTHQHHFEKRAVFVGCGVRAVGTNESNTYRRTERKNTVLRSGNQYIRTQRLQTNTTGGRRGIA